MMTPRRLRVAKGILPKRIKRRANTLRNDCLDLWSEIIKRRAGYKSELSGKAGKQIGGDSVINAHHIIPKSSGARFAYDLANGICLTQGEHKFGIHHPGRHDEYQRRIEQVIGHERMEYLRDLLRNKPATKGLYLTKLYLQEELRKLNEQYKEKA